MPPRVAPPAIGASNIGSGRVGGDARWVRPVAIDGINLHRTDWNGGLVTLFHRFGRMAFSWDLQFEHVLRPALRMGLDGVFSDHVDRMVDVAIDELGRVEPSGGT